MMYRSRYIWTKRSSDVHGGLITVGPRILAMKLRKKNETTMVPNIPVKVQTISKTLLRWMGCDVGELSLKP